VHQSPVLCGTGGGAGERNTAPRNPAHHALTVRAEAGNTNATLGRDGRSEDAG